MVIYDVIAWSEVSIWSLHEKCLAGTDHIHLAEMAKSSKYPYPPKTLYQIVCGIRRFVVEKNPAIELILWTLQTQGESVPRKVEKVSQNVDMDTIPVYFGGFKKETVNFNFKWLQPVSL